MLQASSGSAGSYWPGYSKCSWAAQVRAALDESVVAAAAAHEQAVEAAQAREKHEIALLLEFGPRLAQAWGWT